MGTNAKKTCSKCGKVKFRRQAFAKNACTADGYHCWCRMCVREYQRQYQADNAEYLSNQKKAKYQLRKEGR